MNSGTKKGAKEAIEYIENNLICKIFEFFKTGQYGVKPGDYMILYTTVQAACDQKDFSDDDLINSKEMFEYYKQTIESYIIDCKKKLINEGKDNIIDEFLLHTRNIKFFIFQMQRVFCYLDRFYVKVKKEKSLSEIAFDLYKSLFYEEFKDKIQEEINNLKKEEKNGNEESNAKIKNVMKIEEDMKLVKPRIVLENHKIIWINEEDI